MQFNVESRWKTKNASTNNTPESKLVSNHTAINRGLCRLDAVGRNTEWHEAYDKYSVGKRNKINEKEIASELQ